MSGYFPKLVFLGIDAMMPDVVLNNLDRFPNIRKLCETGATGDYDAYTYGYGSRDNWLSIYTGLTPAQHGCRNNRLLATGSIPQSGDYTDKQPFWEVLNRNGLSAGIWRGIITSPPVSIDGYMFCAEPKTMPGQDRPTHIGFSTVKEKQDLLAEIEGELPRPPLPRTLSDLGIDWEQFRDNVKKYEHLITNDFFREGVDYFRLETEYFTGNMIRVQKKHPVDVLFYYTSILDLVQHFQIHEKSQEQIKRCVDALDAAVGRFIDELSPQYFIILSDHGTEPFGSLFPNMPVSVQREAFGMRDKAVWLSDGNIAVRADNGSLMMGPHALKGFCCINGPGILPKKIESMRTVDFYPTLLEMLQMTIPGGREGFVVDIFNRELNNPHQKLVAQKPLEIAILQTNEVAREGDTINAVFLDYRFSRITVFGQEKYRHAFLQNGRVHHFEAVENAALSMDALSKFDIVIVGNPNPFDSSHPYLTIAM